jgi:hypothetical protein
MYNYSSYYANPLSKMEEELVWMFFRPSKEGDLTVVFWTGQWKKKSCRPF